MPTRQASATPVHPACERSFAAGGAARGLRWRRLVPCAPVAADPTAHRGSPAGSRALILASAVFFSTGGAAIKLAQVSGWQVACLRAGIGGLTLALLLPSARTGWTRGAVLVGCAYAFQGVLFALANKLTTAANTILLQATAPLYVVALAPWLLRERPAGRDLASLVVIAAGLMLIVRGEVPSAPTAPDPALGNALAMASGVGWACTVVGLRWLASDPARGATMAAVIAGNAISCLVCLPFALPFGDLVPRDVLVLGYLGVFQIGASYACLTAGVSRVPALEAALLLLLEPVANPVWAWLVHGETPGTGTLTGGALILSATVLRAWLAGARSQTQS